MYNLENILEITACKKKKKKKKEEEKERMKKRKKRDTFLKWKDNKR